MRKILYIQVGAGFFHVNRNVISQLKKHYPDHEIELFDVLPYASSSIPVMILNSLYVVREYLFDFLFLRKKLTKFKYHSLGTTFMFRYFSRIVGEKIKRGKYEFAIQTQTLCDSTGNGIPVFIYTDHTNLNNLNYRFINPAKFVRSRRFIELERKAYREATLIFVMSQNIRKSLVEQYQIPESKIKIVYVGSNTDVPSKVNTEKYKNKNIIFVGKEWERKGGPLMIEAFRKVQEKIPDASLTIIGCKPRVNVKNCKVIGEVSLDEVSKHYDRASVFCLPTVREPFGIVFIEAMFNRLPIVTNNMGAAPYLISEKNGFLLNNKANEYSEVLIQLLSNPGLCEEMGDESLRLAQEYYTWKNVGNLMSKFIDATQVTSGTKADYSNTII
jgi:glycosyltransferase involved in cell wall biosynthesis